MKKLNPNYYVPYFDQILLVFYWVPNDMRVGLFLPRENGVYHGAHNSLDMPDSAIILAQCRVNRLFVRTFELGQDNQEQMDECVRNAFTHPPRYAPPNESRTETMPHQEQHLEQVLEEQHLEQVLEEQDLEQHLEQHLEQDLEQHLEQHLEKVLEEHLEQVLEEQDLEQHLEQVLEEQDLEQHLEQHADRQPESQPESYAWQCTKQALAGMPTDFSWIRDMVKKGCDNA